MEVLMKIVRYLVLLGLSLIVACGNPPEPPTVTLSATPSSVIVGGSSKLKASVIATNGVTEVEFFEGLISLGKDSSAPFELLINTGFDTAGTREFRAVVTDNIGLTGQAEARVIIPFSTVVPEIALSATPNPVVIGIPSKLTASVVAVNGVRAVEFFSGTTSLGKDLSAPFEIVVDDFSQFGSREFKAEVIDGAGLRAEVSTSVNIVDRLPTFAELKTSLSQSNQLLSPDVATFEMVYESGAISKRTKWILWDGVSTEEIFFPGSNIGISAPIPLPNDGTFGTIVAIPGESDGLLSSRIQYIPPTIATFDEQITVFLASTSVQDFKINTSKKLSIQKKGTLTGISLTVVQIEPPPGQGITPKIGTILNVIVTTSGVVGNVSEEATINFADVAPIGKLECLAAFDCKVTSTSITSSRFKFTVEQTGSITLFAKSKDNPTVTATTEITVTP
jgi:hypothetical protein